MKQILYNSDGNANGINKIFNIACKNKKTQG